MRPWLSLPLVALALAGCQLDWDRLDPRLEPAGDGGAGSGGGTTSSTTTTTTSTTSTGGSGGAGVGGAGGAGVGAGGGGGSEPTVLTYAASVADCIYIGMEDPDLCDADPPAAHMTVDGLVSTYMLPAHSYLRFDLDDQLVGKMVIDVRLRLTVGADPDAESTSTGELYEVAPFTRPDLFVAAPSVVGMLGGDQGAVMPNDTVEWALPISLVAADGSLYLGVLPVASINNGVDYWNADGQVPPALLVTVQ